MVGAIFEGIGVSVGSYVGGLAMENLGGSKTFEIFAIFAFTCFAVHVIIQAILNKTAGSYGKQDETNPPNLTDKLNGGTDTEEDFNDVLRKE